MTAAQIERTENTEDNQTTTHAGQWGAVEALSLDLPGHSVNYNTALFDWAPTSPGGGSAKGGYILVSFDVDGEPYTRVDLEAAAGSHGDETKSPTAMIGRAAAYLAALHARLERIEAQA